MLDGLTIIQSTVAAGTLIVLFVVSDDRDLESYADFTGQQSPNQRADKFCDDTQVCQQLENHINIHCSSFPVCMGVRSEQDPRIRVKQAHQRFDDCSKIITMLGMRIQGISGKFSNKNAN